MTTTAPLHTLTLAQMLDQLESGTINAVQLTEATLEAIEADNDTINAYISVDREGALAQAAAADHARTLGQAPSLAGIPIAIKDIILMRGLNTTAASHMLAHFDPPFDATVVERLRHAGAVLLGKTNCDAFAMGSSNENSAFGPVQNPAAPGRIPGGSSGGSAAAVAAHMCAAALGTDTGGSIRQPAAMTGTVGLKPTYGRVSRFGVVAFASSLDQVGPMGKTTWDVARLLEAIAGHDPRDSTSADRPVARYSDAASLGPNALAGMTLGVPREYMDAQGGIQP
ncbi:MAG: amidase family protein, partial [Myxococcota bacterium]